MLNSGLLHKSWSRISEVYESTDRDQDSGIKIKIYQEPEYTTVVFVALNCPLNYAASILLSGPQDQNPFHFLCSEKISSFSLHKPAFQLFESVRKDLIHLKSELLDLLYSNKQVILTGAALGGSVASLFTLWLLERVNPRFKRPLCITFGSPLIGDDKLQQILENSLSSSCFLHVADAAQTPIMAGFKPFGTFLICVGSGCICIDDAETVTELLGGANTDEVGWRDYGEVLGRLAQPLAVDSRLMVDDGIINRMEERAANKRLRFDRLMNLNHVKISMVYIEFYKKECEKVKAAYYDRYKTHMKSPISPFDMDIEKRKIEVNDYWKELVEVVEKMPQSEKSVLKTRSLFSGNNYRRMVEPLDIAEYYLSGRRDYRTTGRSRHYVILEKWFKAEVKEQVRWVSRDQSNLSTFDSCYWAEVEEAMIATNTLKKQVVGKNVLLQKFAWFKEAMLGTNALKKQEVGRDVLLQKLAWFEEDVREMIRKGEVPREILLERSSFMMWWGEYTEIKRLTFYTL